MAMYKIPQDVEADDKFLGPLSFKQFIFVGIALVASYLTFLSLTKGFWPASFIFVPFIIVGGFLGFPWGRDQPTEVWLAARIRFLIKPRVRIWNQSGAKELVTITAPKHIEKHYTDGLSQTEVSSRLSSLASLLDSRGWAVKNSSPGVYASPLAGGGDNDRLLDMTALPQEVSDIAASSEVLDETSNSTALHFEELIKNSEQKHRQEAMDKLQAARAAVAETQAPQPAQAQQQPADFWYLQQGGATPQPTAQTAAIPQQPTQTQSNDFWFLNGGSPGSTTTAAQTAVSPAPQPTVPAEPSYTTFQAPNVVAPHQTTTPLPQAAPAVSPEEERAIFEKIHKNQQMEHDVAQYGHLKTIQPLGAAQEQPAPSAPPAPASQSAVTAPVNPDIIKLATNDDLNVATIAREAHKSQESSDGEIVISLR
jgi:hypothetical protein